MRALFRDRHDAGRQLASRLPTGADLGNAVVLALPRGGVPVGYEVAEAIGAPLDVFVVRKLGLPGHEELAMGAIATGGVQVLNRSLLSAEGIPMSAVSAVLAREQGELARRERAYRDARPFPRLEGATVILVDDGVATGSTMVAAVAAVRSRGPVRVVVAAPVMAPAALAALARVADACVYVATPEPFHGVGAWYEDFTQTSDEEVRSLLARDGHREGTHAVGP